MRSASDLQTSIQGAFEGLSRKDFPADLAYLVVTMTSESILRDAFATKLRKKLSSEHYAVGRELGKKLGYRDIGVFGREGEHFSALQAGIEIKVVAAPGKTLSKRSLKIGKLSEQLKKRGKEEPRDARRYGLLVVREIKECSTESSSEFEAVIKNRLKSLNHFHSFEEIDQAVKSGAKETGLKVIAHQQLDADYDDQFQIKAKWNLWLCSLVREYQH